VTDIVVEAYQHWKDGDVERFLALFADNAVFAVPGSTRLSGDHDKSSFRTVLNEIVTVTEQGGHRQEPICSYVETTGSVWVFDNYVRVDGTEEKYHSVHEWILGDGALRAWMLYVHEYDVFERAWR
jgi:ketosteroid isomerase-like protein